MRRDAIEQEALKMIEETEQSEDQSTKSSHHFPFSVSDTGVFFIKDDSDPIRIAARVDVIAETRDDQGENWGRLLRWKDGEGQTHAWAMPLKALASTTAGRRAMR